MERIPEIVRLNNITGNYSMVIEIVCKDIVQLRKLLHDDLQKIKGIERTVTSFDTYIWQFVNGKPLKNAVKDMKDVPVKSVISEIISMNLLKKGFKIVGSTVLLCFYAGIRYGK